MRLAPLLSIVLVAAAAAPAAPAPGAANARVEHLSRTRHPRVWGAGPELRVAMAFFDAENRLRWNGDLVASAGGCAPASFPEGVPASARCERRTLMLAPRVDECRCVAGTPGATRSGAILIGLDDSARERWRRVHHPWGPTGGPALAGAHPTGLAFGDGEVWSPYTGAMVRPGERSVALARGCYLPADDAFLEFEADVTLLRTRGGLYLRARDGTRTLVLPVDRRLIGFYDVEDIAPVPGTSLVLLGERLVIRGPGSARFTVFDLAARKVVFRQEFDPDHLIGAVRVLAGTDGHLGFSYLDEKTGEFVLHHYRWRS